MIVTLGFSPCPNDTYMFAALVNGWIDTKGIHFSVRMEDVEQLNEWAGSSYLDVTKMSFHRAFSLNKQYTLLSSGSALGNGCGPLLIAKVLLSKNEILMGPVALPGEWTTAHLLFNLFYAGCEAKEFHLFSVIEDLVLHEEVLAGVIIHENRFTYESKGLIKITDLGEEWESKTGLPIPLGGIFANHRLSKATIGTLNHLIKESIEFARNNPEVVMPYVRLFATELDEDVIWKHIHLYVNDFSLDLGEKGLESISMLKKMLPGITFPSI